MHRIPKSLNSTKYKYSTHNPVVRLLMGRFIAKVLGHVEDSKPKSVLDIGCGEGVITEMIGRQFPNGMVVGTDIDEGLLYKGTSSDVNNLVVSEMPFHCFQPNSFDLVIMTEVLEHLEQPKAALKAISKITKGYALITVPHEPIWRIENMLRLKYLKDWGNTPGHIQHFSKGSFYRLLEEVFSEVRVSTSFPWLVAICRK